MNPSPPSLVCRAAPRPGVTSELTFNGECRVNPELVAFELQIYWFGLLLAQEGEPHSTRPTEAIAQALP